MPTDQSHIIAFLAALFAIALLGTVAFAYIWFTTRKPRTDQGAFDFAPRPPKSASTEIKPPLARV
jgi:uncharacterized membrane protein YpjA